MIDITVSTKIIKNKRSLKDRATEAANKASKRLMEKIYKQLADELQEIYDKEVENFYKAYAPKLYHRTYSLFDALIINKGKNDNGSISIKYDWDYDAVVYRDGSNGQDGNTLLELTFGEGYHGGAYPSGDVENGSPLWRTPYPIRTRNENGEWGKISRGYYRWGSPAYKSDSPYDSFMKNMEKWWTEDAPKYVQPIFSELFAEEFSKVR